MSDKTRKTQSPQRNGVWLRRMIVKVVIVLAAVAVLAGIAKMPAPDRTVAPSETPAVNVKVMEVFVQPEFADAFVLPAVIEPNRVVTISAEVAGRVERMPPKEGDRVKAGDLLIQLNDELIRPQFDGAEAQVKRDEIEFERMEALVKENATSRQDLDDATTRLAASKAQLAEVRARLDRTRIYTPLAGVLNELLVEEGEYVQAGTPVAEVVDMAAVKVVAHVPERDIAFFAVGRKAEVLVQGKGQERAGKGQERAGKGQGRAGKGQGRAVEGTITYINELADQQTRSTSMEITLDNADGRLRSGQIVRVRLTRRVLDDAILIPLLAVIPLEEGYAVYVVKDAQAERREVKLEIIKGDRVQVLGELEPGDKLIIDGHRLVAPGQEVNIVSGND